MQCCGDERTGDRIGEESAHYSAGWLQVKSEY